MVMTYIVVGFVVAVIVVVSMSISKDKRTSATFEDVSKTSFVALIAGVLWPIFVFSMLIAIVGYCIIKVIRR